MWPRCSFLPGSERRPGTDPSSREGLVALGEAEYQGLNQAAAHHGLAALPFLPPRACSVSHCKGLSVSIVFFLHFLLLSEHVM